MSIIYNVPFAILAVTSSYKVLKQHADQRFRTCTLAVNTDTPDLHCWKSMKGSLKTSLLASLLWVGADEASAPKATANRWQQLLH